LLQRRTLHIRAGEASIVVSFRQRYEGEHIVVFYDRVQRTYSGSPQILLAHVVAHEITHILQGVAQHSDEGLMKARWDRDDYARMALQPLTLTKTDLQLIREGVAAYKDLSARRAQIARL